MVPLSRTKHRTLVVRTVNAWKWRVPATGAALVAGAMMLIATAAQAALSVCPSPTSADITACCRITKSGNYTVSGSLTGSGGACIKIEVSGVTLDGGGTATLTGNGTGTGIRLMPSAKGDVVYDVADISNFKTGILDDAPGSAITATGSTNGTVEGNAENGIVIRANRVYLTNTSSETNDGNGVVVKPHYPASMVSNVYLYNVLAQGNTTGFMLKSLSSFTASQCNANTNSADGVDLMNSVNSTLTDGSSYGNTGDGIKLIGGHSDIVNDDSLGETPYPYNPSPNAIGLVVRNSVFDTIDDDGIVYSTGDGMLIVNGNGENITDLNFYANSGSGIQLKRTTSSRVHEVNSWNNGDAGIWLDGSRGISVEGANSYNNGTSDVYIGCSTAQEPDGTTCASQGLPASNGNRVVQSQFNNAGNPAPVGIGIDRGNHNNQVMQNSAVDATTDDLVDENTNCDSNIWMFNTFSTASPSSCIH